MDIYVYVITALLPLAAAMVIFQVNPYHALVMRGILGAIAALVYTVLGSADVALTEALVGTLLAITLYAIAVRSSLVLRLGVLKDEVDPSADIAHTHPFKQLVGKLQTIVSKYHMRVELISYPARSELQQALSDKDVHAICLPAIAEPGADSNSSFAYQTITRLRRLYEIIQPELDSPTTLVSQISPSDSGAKH